MSYRIGELAKAAEVNVETVRYYERCGLIQQPDKPYGSIRSYPETTLRRIQFVKRAQLLGFTLEEISRLLQIEDGNCATVHAMAVEKQRVIKSKIHDLKQLQHSLADLANRCELNPDDEHCPIIDALIPASDP